MSLGELLETCRSRRIELWSEAGRLRYRAPQGALDAGLAERCLLYTSPSPRDYAASRMP
ncbi:hypothetical protein KZ847_35075, partial [Pseudomonas aeruginosa]